MTQKSYKLNWKSSVVRQKLGKRKYWTQKLCGQLGKTLKPRSSMVWEFPPTTPLCAVSPQLKPKLHLDLSKLSSENSSTPDRHVHFPAGLNDERETPPTLPRSQSAMERSKCSHEDFSRSESVPSRFEEFNSILGSFRSFMNHPGSAGGGSNNTTPREDLRLPRGDAKQDAQELVYTPRDANPQAASQLSPPKERGLCTPLRAPAPLAAALSFATPPTHEEAAAAAEEARRRSIGGMVMELEEVEMRSSLQRMHSAWARAEAVFLHDFDMRSNSDADDDTAREEQQQQAQQRQKQEEEEEQKLQHPREEGPKGLEEPIKVRVQEKEGEEGGRKGAQCIFDVHRRQSLDSDFNPVAKLRRELTALHGEVTCAMSRTQSDGALRDPLLQAHCLQLEKMVGALQESVAEQRGERGRRAVGEVQALRDMAELLARERAARGGLEDRIQSIGDRIEAGIQRTQSLAEEREREMHAGTMTPRTLARMVELWVF